MISRIKSSRSAQAGFTLVELAIVMIIIGLLIGGVLKGQELVGNAKVTATVAQIKGTDGAISTFRDMYRAMPGDMLTPATRIPNCADLCATAGDGNGRLDNAPGISPVGTEGEAFFVQLSAADLIAGIQQEAAGAVRWGGNYPEGKINGGFTAGYATVPGDLAAALNDTGARSGVYLTLKLSPDVAAADAEAVLTANQAFRIDEKFDDSLPNAGSVRAFGGSCAGADPDSVYNEADTGEICGLYIRVQN